MVNRFRNVLITLGLTLALAAGTTLSSARAQAQSTEERFQDLFITAGYATAFGAALGAAMLSFVPDPASELRYVAIGASLGFIGGSLMGTYIIFSPVLSMEQDSRSGENAIAARTAPTGGYQLAATQGPAQPGLTVRPELSSRTGALRSITGQWTLATF